MYIRDMKSPCYVDATSSTYTDWTGFVYML